MAVSCSRDVASAVSVPCMRGLAVNERLSCRYLARLLISQVQLSMTLVCLDDGIKEH